jgi:hypothetical protein
VEPEAEPIEKRGLLHGFELPYRCTWGEFGDYVEAFGAEPVRAGVASGEIRGIGAAGGRLTRADGSDIEMRGGRPCEERQGHRERDHPENSAHEYRPFITQVEARG